MAVLFLWWWEKKMPIICSLGNQDFEGQPHKMLRFQQARINILAHRHTHTHRKSHWARLYYIFFFFSFLFFARGKKWYLRNNCLFGHNVHCHWLTIVLEGFVYGSFSHKARTQTIIVLCNSALRQLEKLNLGKKTYCKPALDVTGQKSRCWRIRF